MYSSFRKLTLEEVKAKQAKRALKRSKSRGLGVSRPKALKTAHRPRKRSQRAKEKATLATKFRKIVRERDLYTCQWPGCGYQDQFIDVHHKATRRYRPDLIHDANNGVAICRIHHDFLHHNIEGRKQARLLGLLDYSNSYEGSRKQRKPIPRKIILEEVVKEAKNQKRLKKIKNRFTKESS